jgi:hypothetical protein
MSVTRSGVSVFITTPAEKFDWDIYSWCLCS